MSWWRSTGGLGTAVRRHVACRVWVVVCLYCGFEALVESGWGVCGVWQGCDM